MTVADRFRRHAAGFSLVELLIVLALIAIAALIGMPYMLSTLNRAKMVNAARETSTLMQLARMEAIKHSVPGHVVYNAALNTLSAFADNDRDGAFTAGTDRVITQGYRLPKGIELWGPTDGAAEDTNAIDDWDDGAQCIDAKPGPIFRNDGSANCAGAFRFRDTHENFLEVRIEFPATGKISIQKWFGGGDPETEWWENGEANHKWEWR